MSVQIEITPIEFNLKIGCTPEERSQDQAIALHLLFRKKDKFKASLTDNLSDTIDVEKVRCVVRDTAQKSHVQTAERLGEILELTLRELIPTPGIFWQMKIEKKRFGWSYVQTWET